MVAVETNKTKRKKPYNDMQKHLKFTLISLALSVICLASALLVWHCEKEATPNPKYIFYFIGDGMGFNHILATEQFNAVKEGKSEIERLNFTQFDTRNFVTNYSASSQVTDSAAAGTALSTGIKTANSYIGVDSEGRELRNITDVTSELGYKVGLVTNVGINHATPSCFYSHATDRFRFPDHIDRLIESDIAFVAGSTIMDYHSGPRLDKYEKITTAQLAERLRNAGIAVETDVERAATMSDSRVVLVANPDKNSHVPYVIDRKGDEQHTLLAHTRAAISYMKGAATDRFFLMVEGGKLDYAAHEQDPVATFSEVNEFAQAVQLALDFAAEHPDETLIVVTSDHETGGFALGWDRYEVRLNLLAGQRRSTIATTKLIRQMRAEGKRDWKDYKAALSESFGLWSHVSVTEEEEALLRHDFYEIFLKYGPVVSGLYNNNERLVYDAIRILNSRASLDWTSILHTGMYTPLYVKGAGESLFLECRDQTDIPKVMAKLMGGQL